jgi:hypothetical protein
MSTVYAETARIQKASRALYGELERKGLSHKFDSFFGETDEDEAAVARYDALKKSRHKLPDFFFGDIASNGDTAGWRTGAGGAPTSILRVNAFARNA